MSRIKQLIKQLEDIQSGKLWMGSSYDKKLFSITDKEAFIQPKGCSHSIAQIISHLTAWKEDSLLKITEGRGKMMDSDEKNWPSNDQLIRHGWNKIVTDFRETHNQLIELLKEMDDSIFEKKYYDQDFKGEFPIEFMLDGILHHDIYHLGQIGLIKAMIKSDQ